MDERDELNERLTQLEDAFSLFARPERPPEPSETGHGTVRLTFDGSLTHPAFYGAEERPADRLPFRWMGRADRADFAVAVPRHREREVSVVLAMVIDEAAFEAFTVRLDEREPLALHRDSHAADTLRVTARFAAGPAAGPHSLVSLLAPVAVDLSERGDPRTVSVAVHSVEVREVPLAEA